MNIRLDQRLGTPKQVGLHDAARCSLQGLDCLLARRPSRHDDVEQPVDPLLEVFLRESEKE